MMVDSLTSSIAPRGVYSKSRGGLRPPWGEGRTGGNAARGGDVGHAEWPKQADMLGEGWADPAILFERPAGCRALRAGQARHGATPAHPPEGVRRRCKSRAKKAVTASH